MADSLSTTGIIVLGMHRSGTSVLSRALIALGADFGANHLRPASDNPKGFFEDEDINALNVSFLRTLDCSWHTLLLPTPFPADVMNIFIKRATVLLQTKFGKCPLWGIKDPRITRLLPLWEPAFSSISAKPLYILANRNPFSVADSLEKRDRLPRTHALALWALHQAEGLRAIINNGGMIVDYDLMMQNPVTELDRLARLLGTPADPSQRDLFLDDFLAQELRHSYRPSEETSTSPLTNAYQTFQDDLLKLARSFGALTEEDITSAMRALEKIRLAIHEDREWFTAVDESYRRVGELTKELQESERKVQLLKSRLARPEETRFTKFLRWLK